MLVRKPMARKNAPTLGELLKFKAAQGVKVGQTAHTYSVLIHSKPRTTYICGLAL